MDIQDYKYVMDLMEKWERSEKQRMKAEQMLMEIAHMSLWERLFLKKRIHNWFIENVFIKIK